MATELVGPDGVPLSEMRPPEEALPSVEKPEWLAQIAPGTVYPIAGWWWKLEQAVTNGSGQWALILTPQGPVKAKKKRRA